MKTWIGILLIVVILTLAVVRGLPGVERLDEPEYSRSCPAVMRLLPGYCRLLSRAEQLAWEVENLDQMRR